MKLSIITINYNNLEGLKRTIESVINQTWKSFEWIIIDGGSNDGSKDYIEKLYLYFMSLPNCWNPITFWCSEPDKGIYNAMNKGIVRARGDYMLFLNSGDSLHDKDVLKKMEKELYGDDVVYGDLRFVSKDKDYVFMYPNKITTHYLLHRSLGHPATFIRSCLFNTEGYREDLKIVSDWYAFIKWFRHGKTFRHVRTVVSDFDANGVSSTNMEKIEEERKIVFDDLFGKDNFLWIEESIKMHMLEEKFMHPVFLITDRIVQNGGSRKAFLAFFLKFINKTF